MTGCCGLDSVHVGVEGSVEAIAPKPRISQEGEAEPRRGKQNLRGEVSIAVTQGRTGSLGLTPRPGALSIPDPS